MNKQHVVIPGDTSHTVVYVCHDHGLGLHGDEGHQTITDHFYL